MVIANSMGQRFSWVSKSCMCMAIHPKSKLVFVMVILGFPSSDEYIS
jgi:hypothetical protein